MNKKMVIGIASQQAIRARALAIARGDHQPCPNEPKIWFTSMHSLDDNRALLRAIRQQNPELLSQLPAKTYKRLLDRQDDLALAERVHARRGEKRIKIKLDEL